MSACVVIRVIIRWLRCWVMICLTRDTAVIGWGLRFTTMLTSPSSMVVLDSAAIVWSD